MSLTSNYSQAHAGFAVAADVYRCAPMVARVALALHDRGESATTPQLEADLLADGSAVRRALLFMYDAGLAVGVGVDGERRRPGIVTRVHLTPRGRAMVHTVLRTMQAHRPLGMAA